MRCGGDPLNVSADNPCTSAGTGACTATGNGEYVYNNDIPDGGAPPDGGKSDVSGVDSPGSRPSDNFVKDEPKPKTPEVSSRGLFPICGKETADKARDFIKSPAGTLTIIGGVIATPFIGAAMVASATVATVGVGVVGIAALGLAVYSEFINPDFGT